MFDFHVSSEKPILELYNDQLEDYIRIYNSEADPAHTIYFILPFLENNKTLYWRATTSLVGSQLDLIILTQNNLVIENADFRHFANVLVSDNAFHRDGSKFLVIEDNEHKNYSVLFKNCQAMNAHFMCNNLEWFGGRVKENLFTNLYGNNTKLSIEGLIDQKAVIGNLVIPENHKLSLISLRNVAIINNINCEGVETLIIQNVKTGRGICKLIANEIEELSNFQNLSDELIIKSEIANISSFISPVGKVYIDVHTFIEFKVSGDGRFQGIDLNIDVSKAIEKKITFPFGYIKFDKILINGASLIDVPGSVIAEQMELLNVSLVNLNETRIGHLKYQSQSGKIFFGKHSAKPTKIDSLWLIGNIEANFQSPTELFDLDSDGRCHVVILDDYQGKIIKLNLNLDARRDNIESSREGYFGLHIHNNGNKKVEIETILAKLNSFNVSGSVKLGQVLCQPIDKQYNLLQINVKHLNQVSIDGFFVGYDYNIVIDVNTGRISLVQSMDRALTSGKIIASMDGSKFQNYLNIRAGQGLSFHGNIQVIEGNIELYTLFGMLSVRGSLTAGKQIKLLAIHGSIDLSAELNAYSVITYSGTQSFIADTIINANEFLSQVIGHYFQKNTNIAASKATIISESSYIMLEASNIQAAILQVKSSKDLIVNRSNIHASINQIYDGENIYFINSNTSGYESSFNAYKNIVGMQSGFSSSKTTIRAGYDSIVLESSLVGNEISNSAGSSANIHNSRLTASTVINQASDVNVTNTKITSSEIVNQADKNLSIIDSKIIANQIENYAGRDININRSNIAGNLQVNYAQGNININNSNLLAANIIGDAKNNITIDNSQILSEDNIFFRAVSHYFAVNSNIYLGQFPTTLFLHNSDAIDNNNNPLVRCGFELKDLEVLGILDKRGFTHTSFDQFQYHLVNSSNIELGIFQYIASENPKGIIIDANTGVIMGSSLSAKDHNVIIRTKNGMELLPLNLYNAVIFSGGFNDTGISTVISKIEAGLIDIDGGTYIKSVGALLRASSGSLKADYIYNESFISAYSARNANLYALKPWLARPELYDMIVNNNIVSTRLEFSEVTKIDLGKGKIDLYYPYASKQVYLRQREGDINIDRDSHFSYEVMAVQADQGKIFFGIPKTEQLIFKFFKRNIVKEYQTIEHVNVTGNNLLFSAGGDIDVHGNINVTGTVKFQSSSGNVKIHADKHNFGSTVKQSVINASNAYLVGENVEIIGGIIKVKNHFKIFSHNDVKIIPIELVHRYVMQDSKTYTAEMRIKQIVSEINAGILDIEAGRAVEFVGALIQAEELNLKAKELNIKNAKEIFEKQVEFKGKKKWHGKRNSWSEYDYTEEIVPTVIEVGTLRMLVDNNATIEASQIFVSNEVLTQIGGNLTIKDGYNIHIHDYHAKKYSLVSFNKGNMKVNTTKNIHNFYERGDAIPTLVCAGGIFYGVVEGRMHVLGSTIIGKDIHLAVAKGIKLEVSKYTDKTITFVSETGSKLGYYHKGNTEGGVKVGAYASRDDLKLWETHINQSSLVASNSLSIIVKDGNFEQISSDIAAKIITVEARNWIAKTYNEEIISKHIQEHIELGIKLAGKQTITTAIDKVKMLINKRGNHVIDNLDRVFKAYDAYKSLALLPQNAASGGLYAYLDASRSQELTNTQIAVDNTINGETIIARIKEDVNFSGVKMTAYDVDIEAVNFNFETSQDRYNYEYDCGNVSIDIDLLSEGMLSTASGATQSIRSNTTIHHENYIKASGTLKLTLSGDGKFKGVSLEGVNIDIKANNLILESVQDTVSEKLRGANFQVGFNQEYDIHGFGGGIETGYKNSAWTNQVARIIGSQVVNIAVKETLEIAGGLIANAEEDKDGNLTDKGNLSVNCGRLIVKTIHDYDEGVTLGIGASFQVKASEKEGKEGTQEVSFSHAPVKLELKDKRGEVSSVIGRGNINAGNISGDTLNRDITTQTVITRNEAGSFDSVIHADMFDRLTGNLPKRPVSVKRADTEAVRSYYDPDPSLVSNTGYYFSDVTENIKDAIKDFITGGATVSNFLGSKIDIKNLNTSMDKIFGGPQYMREFASKIEKGELEYTKLVEQDLLTKLGNKKTDLNNNEELLEDTSELGIVAVQKSLEDKIAAGVENKSSLQALLHILKDRYVKAVGKGDFNKLVQDVTIEVLNKNPQFAAKVAQDFDHAVNFAKQIVAGYIYKLILEKAKAEWKHEQAKAKQIKKDSRTTQTTTTVTTVVPNTESAGYANAFLDVKTAEELSKLDAEKVEKINDIKQIIPKLEKLKEQAILESDKDIYEAAIVKCHEFIKDLETPKRSWNQKMEEVALRHAMENQRIKHLLGEDNVEEATIINLHEMIDGLGMGIKHVKELIDEKTTLYFPEKKAEFLATMEVLADNVKKLANLGLESWFGKEEAVKIKKDAKEQVVKVVNWCYENLEEGDREVALTALTFLPVRKIGKIISGKNIAKEVAKQEIIHAAEINITKDVALSASLSIAKAEHTIMVKAHVERLVEHGMIKLDPLKPRADQINSISKEVQKEFLKYQSLEEIVAHPYKMKIVGNAQHTGTPGHAAACMEIAVQHAQKDEVANVFMNQGINKITNMTHPTNIRPDVVIVYKSGKIDFIEVMSKTDKFTDLESRITTGIGNLPYKVRGKTKVSDISEILGKK